jgi:hypothetical protein
MSTLTVAQVGISARLKRLSLSICSVLVCIAAVGCERQGGAVLSTQKITAGSMEFLAVRNSIKYYPSEVTRGYWCRSAATKSGLAPTRELDPFWDARPRVSDSADYRFFGAIGESAQAISATPVFSDIRFVDDRTAYSTSYLVVTFDACLTRTYFNVNPDARLADSMLGLPIDFPDTNINKVPPFFDSLEIHEGGGCFRIHANYVRLPQAFFYCTIDNGQNWTVESPRGVSIVPAAHAVSREKQLRDEGNKIIWCTQARNGQGAHLRQADCGK